MKRKTEPAVNGNKRLLEVFCAYTFDLYYFKYKDMVLHNFLSIMEGDESDPHEIIPISFNIQSTLARQYYTIASHIAETHKVKTGLATKAAGVHMPIVHRVDKVVNPNLKPEVRVKKRRNA